MLGEVAPLLGQASVEVGNGLSLAGIEIGLDEIEQHGAGPVVQDGLVHVEERLPLVFAAAIHDKADMAPGNRDDLRRKLWRDFGSVLCNGLLHKFIFTQNLP